MPRSRYTYRYDRSYALFSCDGRLLLTARCSSDSWAVEVSTLPERERVHSLEIPPEAEPPAIRLTEDNALLVVAGTSLRVFDVRSGERLSSRDLRFEARGQCALTGDGRRVLCPDREFNEPRLCLLDIEPGTGRITEAATFGHYAAGPYDSISLSPDGRYAMTGGQHMSLWDLKTRTAVKRFRDSTYQIYSTQISQDNALAVAMGRVGGDETRAGFVTYDLTLEPARGLRALRRLLPTAQRATWIGAASSWAAYLVGFLPGSHVVLAAFPDLGGSERGFNLVLWNLDTNESAHLTTLEPGWSVGDVSPDGKCALLSRGGTLAFLPLPVPAPPHGI